MVRISVSSSPPLRGEISGQQLPADKSITHRAIVFSALAEGTSQIRNPLLAGVTLPLLNALTASRIEWSLDGITLTIHGRGLRSFETATEPLMCGNSATTIRLLAGALAASGAAGVLDGSPSLRKRPMDRIITPLQTMGVALHGSHEKTAPLRFGARPANRSLHPIDYTLPVASAQVKSCLLVAALAANGPSKLREPGPSRDHTERILAAMGVTLRTGSNIVQISPPVIGLQPLNLQVPGDFSAAAFLIVAALITPGAELLLHDIGLNPTRTGLLDALLEMGADILVTDEGERSGEPVGSLLVKHCALTGTKISGDRVVRMIDEFPIFAVAAAYANGPTLVSQAEELRYKESDRITTLCQELRKLGVNVEETPDGFYLPGSTPPQGGLVESHGDHRLAMALAVAGLASPQPITVTDAEITDESFPGFFETLGAMGARLA